MTFLINALFYQFIFIIVFIFMRLLWRIMVISGDYLCLKCENMKYVCTVVKMTILNSLWQLSQKAKSLHRSESFWFMICLGSFEDQESLGSKIFRVFSFIILLYLLECCTTNVKNNFKNHLINFSILRVKCLCMWVYYL